LNKRGRGMESKKIVYPKSLKDIPLWRRRQLKEDLLWFSRFSPCERLRYIDQEWEEIQEFINKFGLKRNETRKKVKKPNVKDQQDIEYLLKAKHLFKRNKTFKN
jgi:hypothetical protein